MNVHKDVPKFVVTSDDARMVVENVQDHRAKSCDNMEKKREEIIKGLS